MARPENKELRAEILEAYQKTKDVDKLMDKFSLSRSAIYYHLKTGDDRRVKYSTEDRKRIRNLNMEELGAEAQNLGKTASALQKMVERKKREETQEHIEAERKRLEVQGYIDFRLESNLRVFGFTHEALTATVNQFKIFHLTLWPPNYLEDPTGRRFRLSLAIQLELLEEPRRTIIKYASLIRDGWRRPE